MEITSQQKTEIEQIIKEMDCPKEFVCYTSEFIKVGEARAIANGELLECLEEDGQLCRFGLPFGYAVFCQCPLRIYLASELNL
jgi:hypothetical protein